MNNRLKVSYPIGFNEFECIGGRCEDTCCKGWDIEIDRGTFEEYCNIKSSNIKLSIQNNIQKNEDCTSDDLDYGIIKLNREKRCPFLDKSDYCSIYSNIGEEYLSNICTQFPRILNKVDNKYEISLDVACPEAAKIILSNKETLKFDYDEKIFKKYIINDEYNTNSKKYKKSPIKYLKEIRDLSIRIIQNRNYDLEHRLYILGVFIEQLEEKAKNDCNEISKFIEQFDIKSQAQMYKSNEYNYIFQAVFFRNIIEKLNIDKESISDKFKKITEEVMKAFNYDNENKCFLQFSNYNNEVGIENSYIFENFLVNYIYSNLFPFSESDDIFEGYIMLIIRYSFIRFYLVGIYISKEGINEEEIISIFSLFARNIDHDKTYMIEILNYIEKNKYDNRVYLEKFL